MIRYVRRQMRTPISAVIAVNIAVFLIGQLLGLFGIRIVLWVGKVNALIATGEPWRLFTATFTHLDPIHLLLNMWAVWVFSGINRPFYGIRKLLVIYMISGIGGSLLSYAFNPSISIGASGCLYGLLGANLYLLRRNPTAYRQIFSNDILIILAINIIFSILNSGIDFSAHLGGLVTGYFASAAIGVGGERVFAKKRIPIQIMLAAVLIALYAMTTLRYQTPDTYFEAAMYRLYVKDYAGALKKAERGIEKFPHDPRLADLHVQLRSLKK